MSAQFGWSDKAQLWTKGPKSVLNIARHTSNLGGISAGGAAPVAC